MRESQAEPIVGGELHVSRYVTWWTSPNPQSVESLAMFQSKLTPLQIPADRVRRSADTIRKLKRTGFQELARRVPELARQITMGRAPAAQVARMMYEATKGAGDYALLPDRLKGVFWMKGNGAPEELMTFQQARWFPAERLLVLPFAPFMWAWAASRPPKPPFDGLMYTDLPASALYLAAGLILSATALSFKFGPCPGGAQYCHATSPDPLAFASVQGHFVGNMAEAYSLGDMNTAGLGPRVASVLTLEALSADGSAWKRPCYWGVDGCATIEFGTYELVKILDGDGHPVAPYHEEFMKYIGGADLFVWSGWKDQHARDACNEVYKSLF